MNETLHMNPSTDDHGTPPPPAGVPWYRVPLARDASDDKLGGVVSGISRAYGFDVRTTRIAAVLCAFVLPFVVFTYIAAWILLPADPAPPRSLESLVQDRRRRPLYVAVAILGLAIAFGSIGTWWLAGSFGWGIGLVVLGVLLWMATSSRRASEWPPPSVGAPAVTSDETREDVIAANPDWAVVPATSEVTAVTPVITPGAAATGLTAVPATGPTTAPTTASTTAIEPGRPRRRRIPIASITAAATLVVCGVLAAGDGLDWWDIRTLGLVIVGSIVIIAALAVSAVVNRAWWLAPIALALAAGTTVLLVTQPNLDHGVGQRTVEITTPPTSLTERLGAGELVIDLRGAPLDTQTVLPVVAEVGIGNLRIVVPDDAVLVIDAELGAGNVRIDDRDVLSGVRTESTIRRGVPGAGPEIDLEVTMGLGQIEIVHDTAAP